MNKKMPIIAALFVGWVSGAGSWYFIAKGQGSAGEPLAVEQGQGDAPPVALHPSVDEAGGDLLAVIPPPVEVGNVSVLPPAVVHNAPPEMSAPLMETGDAVGVPADDGVVQDTGEFIDADDPQAYIAHLNARSDGGTVQDTGEFIDVDNPPVYAGGDALPQDTGEFIDVDDPQAYAAYWDGQSDGVVQDTGEFIAVDSWQGP